MISLPCPMIKVEMDFRIQVRLFNLTPGFLAHVNNWRGLIGSCQAGYDDHHCFSFTDIYANMNNALQYSIKLLREEKPLCKMIRANVDVSVSLTRHQLAFREPFCTTYREATKTELVHFIKLY